MEDYKYLQQLKNVAPNNRFIDYIIDRVGSSDYRGFQCSQHNRLDYNYFSSLVEIIYNAAGEKCFGIHIGDDNGKLQSQAHTYYQIVKEVKRKTSKGTINSVKKNTFPDIARMGFLDRFDKNGDKIPENQTRTGIHSVALSTLGVKFAKATAFEKIKLFTDGIDVLTRNTASELVEILYLNDFGVDSIGILEYMYILSDDREGIYLNDKLDLLIEYRRLTDLEKTKVDYLLKAFCNPRNRKEYSNKVLLRDYSNWKNESQQIFGLLANSTYFKVENDKLILNTGNYGLFDQRANRGEKAKIEYFKYHSMPKTKGYQLHHIVPFSKAQNKSDAASIDDFRNLIYLKDEKHLEFTTVGKENVIMKHKENDPNVIFLDFEDSFIIVDVTKDALVSPQLLPEIKKYNDILLKKFYYVEI
ncbi:MAG: hypothetical protein J6C61_02635 [Clostridia bacterium]|nr:hypothetical protein [Clostridia bacterium]